MFNFDPRQWNISGAFIPEPVPDNWYKVVVRKSNVKPTRDGQNGYLNLEMEIIEGQYQGRNLFWNFNIYHSSQQTVDIAYKQLAALSAVLNVFEPMAGQNVQDNVAPMLHNKPFYVRTIIAQGPSGPLNNIRDIRDQYGNEPGKPGTAGQPAAMPTTGMPQPAAQGQPQWGAQQPQPAPQQAYPMAPPPVNGPMPGGGSPFAAAPSPAAPGWQQGAVAAPQGTPPMAPAAPQGGWQPPPTAAPQQPATATPPMQQPGQPAPPWPGAQQPQAQPFQQGGAPTKPW